MNSPPPRPVAVRVFAGLFAVLLLTSASLGYVTPVVAEEHEPIDDTMFCGPQLAAGTDDVVYVAPSSLDGVVAFALSPDGTEVEGREEIPGVGVGPKAVAVGEDGDVHVANCDTGWVWSFTPDGAGGLTPTSSISIPRGPVALETARVGVDADYLLVANTYESTLTVFGEDEDGTLVEVDEAGVGVAPIDVAVDDSGSVAVANYRSDDIHLLGLDAAGGLEQVGRTEMDAPVGLAFTPEGHLLVVGGSLAETGFSLTSFSLSPMVPFEVVDSEPLDDKPLGLAVVDDTAVVGTEESVESYSFEEGEFTSVGSQDLFGFILGWVGLDANDVVVSLLRLSGDSPDESLQSIPLDDDGAPTTMILHETIPAPGTPTEYPPIDDLDIPQNGEYTVHVTLLNGLTVSPTFVATDGGVEAKTLGDQAETLTVLLAFMFGFVAEVEIDTVSGDEPPFVTTINVQDGTFRFWVEAVNPTTGEPTLYPLDIVFGLAIVPAPNQTFLGFVFDVLVGGLTVEHVWLSALGDTETVAPLPEPLPADGDLDGDTVTNGEELLWAEIHGDADPDDDGAPLWDDTESDGDGVGDEDEYDADGDGVADDTNGDGVPDFLDPET